MKLNDFVDGITILRLYFDDPDGYHVEAEHDVFYMHATDRPLTPEDSAKMFALGWFQPSAEEDEGEKSAYDPGEGWAAYT